MSPIPGRGPFPAVLDLCTYMSEKRASLLANRGFLVLTVPVYTARTNHEIHLDQFEEAVIFLQNQPKVSLKKNNNNFVMCFGIYCTF